MDTAKTIAGIVIDGNTLFSLGTMVVVLGATWKASRWITMIEAKLDHLHECVEGLKELGH